MFCFASAWSASRDIHYTHQGIVSELNWSDIIYNKQKKKESKCEKKIFYYIIYDNRYYYIM